MNSISDQIAISASGSVMIGKLVCCLIALCIGSVTGGCQKVVQRAVGKSTWHQKFKWKAEVYFVDPQVVALCRAIEKDDLAEIDRLVAAGADVNAQGKGKMTPLMWAFPDNKVDRFRRLLEHGADPNVIITCDFGTRGAIMTGVAVTHMACETSFPGYFEAVFAHGGDPNLAKETVSLGRGDSPLLLVIQSGSANKKNRIRLLLDKGADIDHVNEGWDTPVTLATHWGGQFDIALMLLEAGADHMRYIGTTNSRLVHYVYREKANAKKSSSWTSQQKTDYAALVRWLEAHGESMSDAAVDVKRWQSLSPDEYREKMDVEIAERKAREARKKLPAADVKRAND